MPSVIQDYLRPVDELLRQLDEDHIPRVPGTAVFLTRTQKDAPPVLVWHLKHNRALHERVFILTTLVEPVPRVHRGERLKVDELAPHMWRAITRFGFMAAGYSSIAATGKHTRLQPQA